MINKLKSYLQAYNHKNLAGKENRTAYEQQLLESWSGIYGEVDNSQRNIG